ncbi:MAG: S-layer homology domain-containing protein [Oscillospiraceae bacterium]|nr:S-layer homology domain-containing protein [Oscillospiraceae bacterium]
MKSKKFCKVLSLMLVLTMLMSMPAFAAGVGQTSSESKGNDYPIVLVHGLFGWGGTEIGLNYWGGMNSLRTLLNNAGYTVYTPSIGPVASNWDRACELYAYLVGGTVDYGQYHSALNGHERYGRTFPGVMKELNDPNSTQKVHLVGHSMGGETIRMLAQLLENGDPDEMRATTDGSLSPLFSGNCRHWIESITTLCTPHDGSQYDTKVYNSFGSLVHQFVGILSSATGMNINEQNFGLDFKLDQWGLQRNAGESYSSYFERVVNSNIWQKHVTDLSVYDLDVDGAAVLNSYAKAQDDIYYFSIACSDTYRSPVYPHNYIPCNNINPMMVKSATYMGSHKNYAVGHVNIDEEWWENDGIVSVRSAQYPHSSSSDKFNLSYGTAADGSMIFKDGTQKGVWNYIEKIDRTDHINMVGQLTNTKYLQSKFYELAKMLTSIPAEGNGNSGNQPSIPSTGFVDIVKDSFYYDAAIWANENGFVKGVDETHFAPNSPCTRGQVVTMLWRAAGSPEPKTNYCPFCDVATNSYCEKAVLWANENGITKGTTANTFSPNAIVNRGQVVTFLYRYEGCPETNIVYNPFTDVASGSYCYDAVMWAVANGVTNGRTANTFAPADTCTRAHVVTFIYRDMAK